MTTSQLLERLQEQRKVIESSISLIESMLRNEKPKKKAKAIISSIKKKKTYKGLHWTQRPENQARLRKHLNKIRKLR